MCIVIDTNVLGSVFEETSVNHSNFKPVRDWIIEGKGTIVYGGTKYITEIGKYASLFLQLKKARKAIYIPNKLVDEQIPAISKLINHKNFDDQHIVSLLKVSKCRLICSLDSRASSYFTNSIFFSTKHKPKIYSSSANKNLLCDQNISEICKPCTQTTKAQKKIINIK